MLNQLVLINFKCFKNYVVNFEKFNILIGKNNAGKSTIIDALNLTYHVCRYAYYRKFDTFTSNSVFPFDDLVGCILDPRDIPFSTSNLRYNYTNKESLIKAIFTDGLEVNIIFPLNNNPYAIFMQNNLNVDNKQKIKELFKHTLGIVPPVKSIDDNEELGNKNYVQEQQISNLTYRHFRNIWYYFPMHFDEYKGIIERTMPEYSIQLPQIDEASNELDMFFLENGIPREISWAGHGFQIWLQLVSHIIRLSPIETLILDEPDIYLHSDLQKKLVNLCKERSNQVIISTHAIDIIEEVDSEEIVLIDKNMQKSKRLCEINEVQACLNELGSYQNLKLANFIKGKTSLFIEGKDLSSLKKYASKLDLIDIIKEEGFSAVKIDGFSNWKKLSHINWLFDNILGDRINCYLILDRDYHTNIEIEEIKKVLGEQNVSIHVWNKKELENYLIDINMLYRMFCDNYNKNYSDQVIPLSNEQFFEKISTIIETFKDHVLSNQIKNNLEYYEDKHLDSNNIIKNTIANFNNNWKNIDYKINVIPGKDFFNRLNHWLNQDYKISISKNYILYFIKPEEIDEEIITVLKDFNNLIK